MQFGFGAIPFEGGQFEVPLGNQSPLVGVQSLEAVELEASGVSCESGCGQSGLGGLQGQRQGALLFADLKAQRFNPGLAGIASGGGSVPLLEKVCQQVGVVVHDLEERIPFLDLLAFHDKRSMDFAGQWCFDREASLQGVVGDNPSGPADELLPGKHDESHQ